MLQPALNSLWHITGASTAECFSFSTPLKAFTFHRSLNARNEYRNVFNDEHLTCTVDIVFRKLAVQQYWCNRYSKLGLQQATQYILLFRCPWAQSGPCCKAFIFCLVWENYKRLFNKMHSKTDSGYVFKLLLYTVLVGVIYSSLFFISALIARIFVEPKFESRTIPSINELNVATIATRNTPFCQRCFW